MEIRASGRLDLRSITAYTRLNMFGSMDPKKGLTLLLAIFGAAAVLRALFDVFVRRGEDLAGGVLTLVLIAVGAGLVLCCYYVVPKKKYEGAGMLKDAENRFIFTETGFTAELAEEGRTARTAHGYAAVAKVMETGEFFFLLPSGGGAYIVDKATLSGGTAEELRALLSANIDNYTVCKY